MSLTPDEKAHWVLCINRNGYPNNAVVEWTYAERLLGQALDPTKGHKLSLPIVGH
jgi:hypothetical protein